MRMKHVFEADKNLKKQNGWFFKKTLKEESKYNGETAPIGR